MEGGGPVDTHGLATIPLAVLKHARIVVGWHVPLTTHLVVDVLAERRRLRARLARAEAEHRIGDKVRPFEDLLQWSEGSGEYEAPNGVSVSVSSVRVELSPSISHGDIK